MGDNRETWLLWDKETDEPESLMEVAHNHRRIVEAKTIMIYSSVKKHGIVV